MRRAILVCIGLGLAWFFSAGSVAKPRETVWRNLTLSARTGHALAHDSVRGVTVLFGGWNWTRMESDTWEWDGERWAQRFVAGSGPRTGHAMAYDSARGVVVLFGGLDDSYALAGDTWEYDGNTWTRVSTTGAGPLTGHAIVYDSRRGVIVLFGGFRDGQGPSGETWEWDGDVWRLRPGSGPDPRGWHAMAYDGGRGVTVLFGGRGETAVLADTWEWDGDHWSPRSVVETGPVPPARDRASMVYDGGRGVVVLHGGSGLDPTTWQLDNSVWEWDGTQWTQQIVEPYPPLRLGHAMAYDQDRAVTVVVGGLSNGSAECLSDTWEWDGATWRARTPPGRRSYAMAYDSARDVLVLFGGYHGTYPDYYYGDTWELEGGRWTLRATEGPSPRQNPAMVYHRVRGVSLLFGGRDRAGNRGDTWEWDGRQWMLRATEGPSPRQDAAMAYDDHRGTAILVGARLPRLGDMWEWDGLQWRFLSDAAPGGGGKTIAYDSERRVIVVQLGSQTWEWDGKNWLLRGNHRAYYTYGAAMAYDARRSRTVLLSGYGETGFTTEWDGVYWKLTEAWMPRGREGHSMVYDSRRRMVIAFGGESTESSEEFYDDLWGYGPPTAGDLDFDGDVDLSDFTIFQLCFGGSGNLPAAACPPGVDADLDTDGDVDLADFLVLQEHYTGSE